MLAELHLALKPRGVLFASNPHGDDEEGWNRGRYGAYHAPATWARYVSDAGFVLLDEYFRPAGLPRVAAAVARDGLAQNRLRSAARAPRRGRYVDSGGVAPGSGAGDSAAARSSFFCFFSSFLRFFSSSFWRF